MNSKRLLSLAVLCAMGMTSSFLSTYATIPVSLVNGTGYPIEFKFAEPGQKQRVVATILQPNEHWGPSDDALISKLSISSTGWSSTGYYAVDTSTPYQIVLRKIDDNPMLKQTHNLLYIIHAGYTGYYLEPRWVEKIEAGWKNIKK